MPTREKTLSSPAPTLQQKQPVIYHQQWFPLRKIALMEMVVFFIAALLYDYTFGMGSRFFDMPIHPFWVILLLVIVQYGPNEAIVCALLASVFLLLGHLPEQRITETMYEYALRMAKLPFLWMITAMVLGSIRSRELQEKQVLKQRMDKAEEGAETIAKAYTNLRKTKDQLELRLAEERKSVVTVYKAAQVFDMAGDEYLLQAATEMVRVALNPGAFSLYRLEENALSLVFSSGWETQDAHPQHYSKDSAFYRAIVERKATLSITSARDEELLGNAILAGPILSPDKERVVGLLKIEEMKFTELSVRSLETFRIICQWIGKAMAPQAQAAALARTLEPNRMIRVLTALARRQGFGLYQIGLNLVNRTDFSAQELTSLSSALESATSQLLRDADMSLLEHHGEGIILVSCQTNKDAENLVIRLHKNISNYADALLARANYEFSLDSIYEYNAPAVLAGNTEHSNHAS